MKLKFTKSRVLKMFVALNTEKTGFNFIRTIIQKQFTKRLNYAKIIVHKKCQKPCNLLLHDNVIFLQLSPQ